MIVVDTNVIAYLYLPTSHTNAAESLFLHDPEWVAPILWRSEFRNVLAGHMRRKLITLEQARSIQSEAEFLLAGREYEVDSGDVLTLVHGSSCSAYDCEFVALAKKLSVRLVTVDAKLRKAFPELAVSLDTTA